MKSITQIGQWTVYNYAPVEKEIKKYIKPNTLIPASKYNNFLIDPESWYSITPVELADLISERVKCKFKREVRILDLFSGVGGNTISFLKYGNTVDSVENDYRKIRYLRHNVNSCLEIAKKHRIFYFSVYDTELDRYIPGSYDVLMASPPWGGVEYKKDSDLELFNRCNILKLEKIFREKARLRLYMVPRQIDNRVFLLLNDTYAVFNGRVQNRTVSKILAVGDVEGFTL